MKRVHTTPTAEYFMKKDIIVSRVSEKTIIDVDGVKDSLNSLKYLGKGQKVLLLSDIRKVGTITKSARAAAQGKKVDGLELDFGFNDVIQASAILVNSGVSRILGNLFIGLNRPAFPTKIFTKEDQALEWLSAFKENTN